MTPEQIKAVQRVSLVLLETIEAEGDLGAPSGPMFAALQTQGCTMSQYQQLMGQLEHRGFVTRSDHCYTITPAGKNFRAKLQKAVA